MKTFKRIYIEITNICNLRCSFCPDSKRHKGSMSVIQFEKILKKLQGHGTYIYLHVKGEPLMHGYLEQILDLCTKYNMKVTITTNGTLLFNRVNMLIRKSCVRQVSVSLQSFEEACAEASFNTYMEEVLGSVNIMREHSNIISELRLWNYQGGELSDLVDQRNKRILIMIKEALSIDDDEVLIIPEGKGKKLIEQVYLSKNYLFEWPDINIKPINTIGTCYGLRQQVAILVNGDVVPCCLDSEGEMTLGNIFKQGFEDIVTSDRAKVIVEGFEMRKIVEPLCERCGYRSRFD